MRTRRDLAEYHVIPLDEHLHSEYAVAAQSVGYPACYFVRALLGERAHALRLPRFAVVAVHLMMPDRFEHRRACAVAHGKQRYFVVEIDESLDDDATRSRATALLGAMPCGIDLLAAADCALTVSRRTHYGFYHARYADFVDSSDEILVGVGETR